MQRRNKILIGKKIRKKRKNCSREITERICCKKKKSDKRKAIWSSKEDMGRSNPKLKNK